MVPRDELDDFSSGARTRKFLLIGLAVAIGVGALLYGILSPAAGPADAGAAPDFELPLLNDEGTLTSRELQGSPVIINFFASWCVPCREEAPLLEETYERYRDQGLVFVGVSIRDAAPDARDFVDQFGITYPVVHDPQEVLAKKVGVLGLPETYFITSDWRFEAQSKGAELGNRQGTVWFGPITKEELEKNIEELLADQ
jgi:cytochrome c biogenesis protein CcmG/thiol:disulfide interchange protein DsbE